MCTSLWPCGLQPSGLLRPWASRARILEWAAISSLKDPPNPGVELVSPAWQADSLPLSHQGSSFTPWSTAFVAHIIFLYVEMLYSFISNYFKVFLEMSSLTHGLIKIVLPIFHIFGDFSKSLCCCWFLY